jgi:hypothetical protein
MSECDSTPECELDCAPVFMRLQVRPTMQHGTWVEWLLDPSFADPLPHQYQLQVGHTASNLADDWVDVGLSSSNAAALQDDQQRVFGKTQWTHYRVRLQTPLATYYSQPANCWGELSHRDWQLLKARERQWRMQLERTVRGQQGYLLKRRLTGERPEPGRGVIDYGTMEIVNPQAAETLGTDFIGGYYEAIPCISGELTPLARHERLDGGRARGTVNDELQVRATMLAVPQLDTQDVWVDKKKDFRWEIFKIEHAEEIRGVPVVVNAYMRLLPFSHVVYSKGIAGQTPE